MAVAVILSLGCYFAYAQRLGKIDGLPPLPKIYYPPKGGVQEDTKPKHGPRSTDRKLEMSFGPDCPELKRPIKIDLPPPRGIVLAAKDFQILDDGRVKLQPISVALFGKNKGEDGTPEINTLRGEVSYFTFEHPIKTVSDMGKYKIIAAQVTGQTIRIVNNRRTRSTGDDLTVDIKHGPLFYDQMQMRIWTDEFVHLEDAQSKPKPTTISGLGMVLDLMSEQAAPKRGRKSQSETITGVRKAHLHSDVEMNLYVDSRSGFLGPVQPAETDKSKTGKDARAEPEKSHVIIKTFGPFHYDLQKEYATFDKGRDTTHPTSVRVDRFHDALGKHDQLDSDHLELQFYKKEQVAAPQAKDVPPTKAAPVPANASSSSLERSTSLQIETAHAIGNEVTLVSDTEGEAHGVDFFHDARIATSILKGKPGKPMWAMKDGNTIQACNMRIHNTKTGQVITARGPGIYTATDKTPGKKPVRAHWDDTLTSSRDGEQDLIHLTGNAAFLDEETNQELHGDDLKVWLLPQPDPKTAQTAKAPAPPADANKSSQSSRKPHHVISVGHVRAHSKDFNVPEAQRLVMWFTDAPPGTVAPAPKKNEQPAKVTQPPAAGGAPMGNAPTGAQAAQPAETTTKQPINLTAVEVEAHILRYGDKSQLQTMRSQGKVHVVQAPEKKGEKGLDIQGDTLNVTAFPEGNFMVVTGDLARVDTDKMLILGPEVNVDQVANKAWVNGMGAMTIESDTDLEGKKLKKSTPLTIHWNRTMVLSGRQAVFEGNIQADQENSRMTCKELQVTFDKPISLREPQKEKDRSKVSHLVCDKTACVEDQTLDPKGLLLKYTFLRAVSIAYDNDYGEVEASGPGETRTLQHGDEAPGVTSPAPSAQVRKPDPTKKDQKDSKDPNGDMKLTYVNFCSRMHGFRKENRAIFWTNVRVLNLPSNNPRMEIDLDKMLGKLPEGALYLRCDVLEVRSRPLASGKANQEMVATGRVTVTSNEFHGEAGRVSYDEEKDLVIFDGQGGMASLTKFLPDGRQQRMIGQKIFYSRRTGEHKGEGIQILQQ
jgi:lipopolysaccharide export system protein LptA